MAAEKTAKVVWSGAGQQFTATTESGYSIDMRAPADAEGATPMDFMLASVAGCTAFDVLSILQKKRQDVQGIEIQIRGTQAPNPPNVYTDVTITYVVTGSELDEKALERAIELSETKYCSASMMFQRSGTQISSTYEIREVEAVEG